MLCSSSSEDVSSQQAHIAGQAKSNIWQRKCKNEREGTRASNHACMDLQLSVFPHNIIDLWLIAWAILLVMPAWPIWHSHLFEHPRGLRCLPVELTPSGERAEHWAVTSEQVPKEPKCLEARFDHNLFSEEWYSSLRARPLISMAPFVQLPFLFCHRLCSPLPVLPRSRPLRFTFGQAVRQTTGGSWDLSNTCTCFEGAVSDTKFSLGLLSRTGCTRLFEKPPNLQTC